MPSWFLQETDQKIHPPSRARRQTNEPLAIYASCERPVNETRKKRWLLHGLAGLRCQARDLARRRHGESFGVGFVIAFDLAEAIHVIGRETQ